MAVSCKPSYLKALFSMGNCSPTLPKIRMFLGLSWLVFIHKLCRKFLYILKTTVVSTANIYKVTWERTEFFMVELFKNTLSVAFWEKVTECNTISSSKVENFFCIVKTKRKLHILILNFAAKI